ncbi:MAG: hypothetical protein ACLFWD_11585 [Anaerolineales bacterium]
MKARKAVTILIAFSGVLVLAWLTAIGGVSAATSLYRGPVASPYVEVRSGTLPLIISVPHGGNLTPGAIPDRTQAVLINDRGSLQAARELDKELKKLTGHHPTLIINHLDRRKLDPNRSLAQGAQGNPIAEAAWRSFHTEIEGAAQSIGDQCASGLILDFHSYGGENWLIQLGYGLDKLALEEEDEDLSKRRFVFGSNLRALALRSDQSLADLVRGEDSLGGRLESDGYRAVPSPTSPQGFYGYFDGGYISYQHGSHREGTVDAVQVEIPYSLLSPELQERFISRFAGILRDFLTEHYQLQVEGAAPRSCAAFSDVPLDHWSSLAIDSQFDQGHAVACAYEPRRFCPDREISRLEAATWLWTSLAHDPGGAENGEALFADLTADHEAAEGLWQRGIAEACLTEPLRFCPDKPLTREQMAGWLLRAQSGAGLIPPTPSGAFADIPMHDWKARWVEEAFRQGLLRPCGASLDNRLCPQQPVTRAEWAWAVEQLLGR